MASNTSHMNSFTTLIKRLEAATSRLEDMASALEVPSPSASPAPEAAKGALATHQAPPRTAVAVLPPPPPPAAVSLPKSIEAFDELINTKVKPFVGIAQKIGGAVAQQAQAVLEAFEAERKYLLVSTKSKKPDPQPPELLTELHRASDEINNIRESNRPSPLFNHLSAISEGVMSMGWFFEIRPAEFVTDVLGGAQFYGNRVLNEYKEKDKTHVEYIQAYYVIFRSLIAYITEYFPRGILWNKDGVDVMEALKEVSSEAPVADGAPPPPPPPPLPNLELLGVPPPPGGAPVPQAASNSDMSAVFEQLNQGSAITSNLRKVDKSEMTHKNPSLRASSLVSDKASSQIPVARGKSPAPSKKPKPESMRAKKPSRKQLDGNKWFIEHFDNPGDVIDISASLTQSILVSRCHKTIVKVSNKANAISIDNCSEVSIIIDSLVSSLEVIKSPKFALQIDGVVPTVMLDQVDSATIYLSQASLGTDILTSKCTSVNIVLPPKGGSEDMDDKECPVPEQIRSYVKDGALVSEIVEHAG
ncbi:suppressor of rasval19 [Ophidiomyces ophidiicola]|uniref:suppressor of rasval19 n=1 Tax=Ophidiomyces ophidiicola TaxID=1387563 RepID=UPI0020C2F806|nr:suppressor of rasval19 [Ophidiomyces ophidiicola]KAI1945503.1 suppressor of rasval19 [Ophidiomyces ophidiicola]KAI2063294.1 suppressor of rasval19 [Ophidiomyces ophidiicola]